MIDKPNVDLLMELFNSGAWQALKKEIEVCKHNAEFRLKKEGEANRDWQAGAVTAYETIIALELRYKNPDLEKYGQR